MRKVIHPIESSILLISTIAAIVAMVFVAPGCEKYIEEVLAVDSSDEQEEVDPGRGLTPDKPSATTFKNETKGALSKPISTSTKRQRFLTPSKHKDPQQRELKLVDWEKQVYAEKVEIWKDGHKIETLHKRPLGITAGDEKGDTEHNPNNGRIHWDCQYPGATYGAFEYHEYLSTGAIEIYKILDGSVRWKGTPGHMVRD